MRTRAAAPAFTCPIRLASRCVAAIVLGTFSLGSPSTQFARAQVSPAAEIAGLEATVDHDPANVKARYRLGVLYSKHARHQDAILAFKGVLRATTPRLSLASKLKVYKGLAVALFKAGRCAASLRCVEAVCRLAPGDAKAERFRAQVAGRLASASVTDRRPVAVTVVSVPTPPASEDAPPRVTARVATVPAVPTLAAQTPPAPVPSAEPAKDGGCASVKEGESVEELVSQAAALLDDEANWKDASRGRELYARLRAADEQFVTAALVRAVQDNDNRLHALFLTVKLGIAGSEATLSDVLSQHGDKSMAEDYLNSGSKALHDAGSRWAAEHGYFKSVGMGSHRVAWGEF